MSGSRELSILKITSCPLGLICSSTILSNVARSIHIPEIRLRAVLVGTWNPVLARITISAPTR